MRTALALLALASVAHADHLPGTQPLTDTADPARTMVDGIGKYLHRELKQAAADRGKYWKLDTSSAEAFTRSVQPNRERLKKLLGIVDTRLPPKLEYVGGPASPHLVAETPAFKAFAVRWAVLPGIDGEGLLLEPTGKVVADVIDVPDADQTPEQVCGLAPGVAPLDQFARRLADSGCRVIVPVLIDRKDDLSANPMLNRATNQPHREFVHRMAYEMGRTLLGYEVQKVLAAVDWLKASGPRERAVLPLAVVGYGEGVWVVTFTAAIDSRIARTVLNGPDQRVPVYRNVWSFEREFGGEAFLPLLPRRLVVGNLPGPTYTHPVPRTGRSGAAPLDAGFQWSDPKEFVWKRLLDNHSLPMTGVPGDVSGLITFGNHPWDYPLKQLAPSIEDATDTLIADRRPTFDPAARHKRQFDQLVAFTQKLWRDSDAVRRNYWKNADSSLPEKWEASCDPYRRYFHDEVIGKLSDPTMPMNVRTRKVYDEPKWTGYEVVLDVYPDVIASGILLLPKGQKPGERRPVVVCQHGLEGRPVDVVNPRERTKYYNSFGAQLADLGYVVYAPQNPYIFKNDFRQLQRLANPLKLSLFSFIIAQHRRTLDWLETLPQVDPRRIAFYGLSYGGKTAMRVPAVEKRYCLSICSGDFNEWIGKNVSVDLDRSYMWTNEYEMYEFDLGNTFNYAEMAYLIAPRPFMVERGHDDGVGTDDMVASEYAKVRYLYANRLKLPDRTAIEFFAGGHEVNGKGTFAFLKRHLQYP